MPAPNSGTVPRMAAFSGRYSMPPAPEAAPNTTGSTTGRAPPSAAAALAGAGASAAGLPPVSTQPPRTHSAGSAAADNEENPYLADTPYYLSTLKGKAHDAKTEILVRPSIRMLLYLGCLGGGFCGRLVSPSNLLTPRSLCPM
jgi:hypothetical protein